MKKIFNSFFWRARYGALVLFLLVGIFFTYEIPACASEKKVTLVFSKTCAVNQKISSPTVRQSRADSIGPELIDAFLAYDKKYSLLSPVCEFELPQYLMYTTSMAPVEVVMRYQETEYRPRIFFWDEEKKAWSAIDTTINRQTRTARAELKAQKGIVSVFADESDAYEGIGSWYRHARYPNGSATNIFPIGTKLKVTNLENNKSTIVAVTSTWTNTDKKRVIDLVSTAFKKIAPLSKGLIKIRIEKI